MIIEFDEKLICGDCYLLFRNQNKITKVVKIKHKQKKKLPHQKLAPIKPINRENWKPRNTGKKIKTEVLSVIKSSDTALTIDEIHEKITINRNKQSVRRAVYYLVSIGELIHDSGNNNKGRNIQYVDKDKGELLQPRKIKTFADRIYEKLQIEDKPMTSVQLAEFFEVHKQVIVNIVRWNDKFISAKKTYGKEQISYYTVPDNIPALEELERLKEQWKR